MEKLFNNFARHPELLDKFESLITEMNGAIQNSTNKKLYDKELADDIPVQIDDYCDDLRAFILDVRAFKDYRFYQSTESIKLIKYTKQEYQIAISILEKVCPLTGNFKPGKDYEKMMKLLKEILA